MNDSKQQPPLVDAQQLRALVQSSETVIIVDVRSAEEFAAGTIEGAINVPADQLADRSSAFPNDATVVTVCNHGGARSCGAAEQLRSRGFHRTVALKGGVRGFSTR